MGPENAFQTLKLSGLSTTADLRRVHEQARVRQALTKSDAPDSASRVVERLLADPGFRTREAAAWYFGFATHEETTSAQMAVGPHDRVRALWHEINRHAQGGTGGFEGACRATAELANNPSAWLPLEQLIRDIADARLDSASIPAVVEEATARWITEGLIALVRLHSRGYQNRLDTFCADAAEIVRNTDGLPERVVAIVVVDVLEKAADELESAANAFESETALLFEKIEGGGSDGKTLADAAGKLVAGARPWSELVGVLDDDPFSGREGHALDRVAQLIRRTAVALHNHAADSSAAAQLLDFASYIAQSDSARASHQRDARTVRYLRALNEAIAALRAWDIGVAGDRSAEVTSLAETEEERVQARELQAAVLRARSGQPMVAVQREQSGVRPTGGRALQVRFGSLIGGLVTVGIVIWIASAIFGSSQDSGTSKSGGSVPENDSSGIDVSGLDAESDAIDRERARIERVESDLVDMEAEIADLAAWLDRTLSQYPNGAPNSIVTVFESKRLQHNRLVDEYERKFAQYEDDLEEFNQRVAAYNRR